MDACPVASKTLRSYRSHAGHANMLFAIYEGLNTSTDLQRTMLAQGLPPTVWVCEHTFHAAT